MRNGTNGAAGDRLREAQGNWNSGGCGAAGRGGFRQSCGCWLPRRPTIVFFSPGRFMPARICGRCSNSGWRNSGRPNTCAMRSVATCQPGSRPCLPTAWATRESARPTTLAAALTAVGCICAASRPIMPYCALPAAIPVPRRVRVSLDAAPRRRRHGTAPSIAEHRDHHQSAAVETHRASRTIGHTPARPRDFSSLSVSPKQGGYQHCTRGSETRGGRWPVGRCVGASVGRCVGTSVRRCLVLGAS